MTTNFFQKNFENTLLTAESSIEDANKSLTKSSLRICLVIDERKKLLGTVTDGDIRRGMLNGLSLKANIFSVLNKNPFVVPEGLNSDAIRQIMVSNKIFQVPEVDKEYHLLNLYCIDQLFEQKKLKNKFVIMAGGRGTRLKPLTDNCPKPMLVVKGKPILLRIIEQAKSEGFSDFAISTNYLSHIIQDYFRDGSEFGVKIDYITENKPLGTAGSLTLLKEPPSIPVMITNGDVISDIKYSDLLNFHLKYKSDATMAVRLQERINPYGVVSMDGIKIVGISEKPREQFHINAGIYVVSPNSINILRKNSECDMTDMFEDLRTSKFNTFAYPIHEPWLDIGSHADFSVANNK